MHLIYILKVYFSLIWNSYINGKGLVDLKDIIRDTIVCKLYVSSYQNLEGSQYISLQILWKASEW